MSSAYLYMNAWREILARVFDGVEVQRNVSPEWLVNPATRRRLKLDYFFPPMGVAVRFSGLTAKRQRRRSDWEVLEDEQRDQTRAELCRLNGVQLAVIVPFEDPVKQMDTLLRVLNRARRLMAQSDRGSQAKKQGMDRLAGAIHIANRLRSTLSRRPEQMTATLAEAWRDRETGIAVELQKASTANQKKRSGEPRARLAQFTCGQRVVHTRFGAGVITAIGGEGADRRITVRFDADRERTFLASLVSDKLRPVD